MPDISMCSNNECPRRHECYRYMATPSASRQSYFMGDGEKCEYFEPLKTPEKKKTNEPSNR